jgi:hypothetical protein
MPILSIIRGLPTSGKSTLARKFGCLHLEADMFFMVDGSYRYDALKIEAAPLWCQRMAFHALLLGFDVVVSNTFTRVWELDPYLQMAKESGSQVSIYRTTRDFVGLHRVPELTLEAMRLRLEDVEREIFVGDTHA